MSRLTFVTESQAEKTLKELYKDIERRIQSAQPNICPVDMALSFIKMCHSQSCGKCTPCRIGLSQLELMLQDILDGNGNMDTINQVEETAKNIYATADCAIGFEAAKMVLTGVKGFREDYEEHVLHGRCKTSQFTPVPCVAKCPAHVDIPGYISLIHNGRYQDAVNLIRKDNPFPSVCGLICEHPCEEYCRRTFVDGALNIRGLKRYAVEHADNKTSPKCFEKTGKKVAIIGGGPSGLSAAYYLSIMGHEVVVYEQRKKAGGMLRYGIPSYRLPRTLLDKEIEYLTKTGFKIITDTSVGKDITIDEIKKNNDAIYIAIGAHTDKKIGIEGEDAKGVISAVEMLRSIGDQNMPDFKNLDIVVVGGGNVAMDVARSAIRLGAKTVKIIYRRRKDDMTALKEEVEGAIADGCQIVELNAPIRIEKDNEGKVKALVVKPQIVGHITGGRPAPVDSGQDEVSIPCDRVLVAIGQGIYSKDFEDYGIPVKKGAIETLASLDIKNFDGIFSGGDCVTGPATVIKAIAGGKIAAANIDEYLGFKHEISSDIELPAIKFSDTNPLGRINMVERPACERVKDFDLMEIGMTDEEAHQESSRCLHCNHFGYGCFRGGREAKW